MKASQEAQRQAILEVGKFIGSTEGIHLFAENEYRSNTRILVALESEPLDLVLDNHIQSGDATLVAVHFPDRAGSDRFEFLLLSKTSKEKPEGVEDGEQTPLGRGADGHLSSIGTFADWNSGRIRRLNTSDIVFEEVVQSAVAGFNPKQFVHA